MKTETILDALKMLRLEAIHYRNTGKGERFLNIQIDNAEQVLLRAAAQAEREKFLAVHMRDNKVELL